MDLPNYQTFEISAWLQENLSSRLVNNKGADQPAHWHSLISAFVIRFLVCVIYKLDKGDISFF